MGSLMFTRAAAFLRWVGGLLVHRLSAVAALGGLAMLAWAGYQVFPALGWAIGGAGLFLAGGGTTLVLPPRDGRHDT